MCSYMDGRIEFFFLFSLWNWCLPPLFICNFSVKNRNGLSNYYPYVYCVQYNTLEWLPSLICERERLSAILWSICFRLDLCQFVYSILRELTEIYFCYHLRWTRFQLLKGSWSSDMHVLRLCTTTISCTSLVLTFVFRYKETSSTTHCLF